MGKIMVITASQSIEDRLKTAISELLEAGIDLQMWVIPKDCSPNEFRRQIVESHADVYIVGSSMANTLSAYVKAHTSNIVIGIPISSDSSDTDNAILNTNGLPTGTPYGITMPDDISTIHRVAKKLTA